MSDPNDHLEYIRDMASPTDGPDLTDAQLAEVLNEMSHDITYKQIKNNSWISLTKLIGKKIVDLEGYLSTEFGDPDFLLVNVVFEDGTRMGIEGEHDHPYLVNYRTMPQPNFDDDTLERLRQEQDDD